MYRAVPLVNNARSFRTNKLKYFQPSKIFLHHTKKIWKFVTYSRKKFGNIGSRRSGFTRLKQTRLKINSFAPKDKHSSLFHEKDRKFYQIQTRGQYYKNFWQIVTYPLS